MVPDGFERVGSEMRAIFKRLVAEQRFAAGFTH
jgi:hypothetical protein